MILEVRGISQSFAQGFWSRQKPVLFDVNLSVPKGSIYGFLGANGAGKTTLIHLIAGLKTPRSGSIRIAGLDIHAQSAQAKRKLGYLPERPYFYEHLTGEAFLHYLGTLSDMAPEKIRARIPEALAVVGMSEARSVELKNYSKGMLQRIGIAQAILHEPELLVFDEPMSGLDPVGRREIRELMLALAKRGHTLFFSTHVIPDAEAICDQVAILQKGRILGAGPLSAFLAGESQSAEIGVTGISETELQQIPELKTLQAIPEGFRGRVENPADQARVIQSLSRRNARILWLTPERVGLENFFRREREVALDSGEEPHARD